MRTRPLRMRRITWLLSRGSKTIIFWESRPRFAYSLCNFRGSTMKVIKVVCENNALPCVKRRMSFCACAKSRDLLKVSYVSYCSRSRRRRFTVLDFKSWAYGSIYGHFRPRFPIRVENFGDSATFSVDFCILYLNVAIFLLPVCLTYWSRKYTTRVDPHINNSHQVWSWYDHPLPSYSVFV